MSRKIIIIIGTIFILNLFLIPRVILAKTLVEQTQVWNNQLITWQLIQELGNNLSGKAKSFTFRVSTAVPNWVQFNFTAQNSRIYDKDNNNFSIAGCIGAGEDSGNQLRGLTFTTDGMPQGFEDVTIDFSCRDYEFIPGHRYLVNPSNANSYVKIYFTAAAYGTGGQDFFEGGGLRVGNGNPWDWYYNAGWCSPVKFIWHDLTLHPESGCNIWTSPQDDLYFILKNNTPEPTPTPTPTPSKTPLVFIPGIGGSELKSTQDFNPGIKECGTVPEYSYKTDEIVWVNKIVAAKAGCDDYFDVLKLKTDGQTPEYPQITLSGNIYQDSYGDLINFFQENGYELNITLFIFPYDWRKDIALTSTPLDQKINEIKKQTNAQKIDIVAHSMGGLVAKNYIQDKTQAGNVRKLITLGTPYLGSVKLLKALHYGDFFGPTFLFGLISINSEETKDIAQNFTGTFELLPSRAYYEFYNNSIPEYPVPFRDDSDIDKNGVTGPLNFDQTRELLANFNHNINLFNLADNFHNQLDKIWQESTNGVETSLIIGSGQPTLTQIHEQNKIKFHFDPNTGFQINKREEIFTNGDDTVPLYSASLKNQIINFAKSSEIYYVNQEHGNLVNRNSGPALTLVEKILEGKKDIPDGVQNSPYQLKGKAVIVQSPVELHIYDSQGNHTGPTTDENFETNIPGSSYDTLGSSKIIWLPDEGQYTVKLSATDNGSFDLKIRNFENDANTQTIIYHDVPIINTTQIKTDYNTASAEPPVLQVDNDGNGVTDTQVNATSTLASNAVFDQTAPKTTVNLTGTDNVLVELIAEDETNGSGILKTEYSLDNGQTIQRYSAPFTISQGGTTTLKFRSIDQAGNEEVPNEQEIKIDKTTVDTQTSSSSQTSDNSSSQSQENNKNDLNHLNSGIEQSAKEDILTKNINSAGEVAGVQIGPNNKFQKEKLKKENNGAIMPVLLALLSVFLVSKRKRIKNLLFP